jgi:hypothetical protein
MNKLDTIIDALESAYEDKAGWCDKVNEALYAAHELKALKPLAYYNKKHETVITAYELGNHVDGNDVPLYALEVTK